MWLTSSSIGRKFIMALTGAFLILFVTFHVLMNGVAILSPKAYNVVCEFLGANWYALVGTLVLAGGFALHILLAMWLTWQNRRARGTDRYAVTSRPAQVEWSSKNMLVLGIVVVAFLVLHMYQFWAKMQLVEVLGLHSDVPPAAGTLLIHQTFSQPWVVIVYLIGFAALWMHMTHGFWSMFQSCGCNGSKWFNRMKTISTVWATAVCVLFAVEAVVFTVNAKKGNYINCPELVEQYNEMAANSKHEHPMEILKSADCKSECANACEEAKDCTKHEGCQGDKQCTGNTDCAQQCAGNGECTQDCANCPNNGVCQHDCADCAGGVCKEDCTLCAGANANQETVNQ